MGDINAMGVLLQRDPVSRIVNAINGCTFSWNEELEQENIDAYPNEDCGVKRDIGLSEKKSTMTVTVGTKTIDDESWGWMIMNTRSSNTASLALPNPTFATVTGGVLSVPGLTLDQTVSVTIMSNVKPGKVPLTQQPSGTGLTASTFEVGVDQITVDGTHEGKRCLIYYFQLVTNQEIFGGDTPISRYSNIELFGKICGDKMSDKRIWFPDCTSDKGASLDNTGDEYTREYTAFVDFARGFQSQYVSW